VTAPDGNFVESSSRPPAPVNRTYGEYLTSTQVGELLQVSARTIERWALEDPTMPRLKVGRTLRFPWADLQRWLERRTQGSRKVRTTAAKCTSDIDRAPDTLSVVAP